MKLRKIKWSNHPILGNLELNLVNPESNTPYDTIVIAGENGTGKTTILDTLYAFLSQGPITSFDYIEYQINDEYYKVSPIPNGNTESFFIRENLQKNQIETIRANRNNNPEQIRTDIKDPRYYGTAYTKARANYELQPIRTILTTTIDDDKYKESTETNATALKQLIVDIQTQDNNEFALLGKQNPSKPITWQQFENQSKMHRFSSAFNNFFNHELTYDRISVKEGVYDVLFKKHNVDISIDKLSTGESQIVFRGTYLLKNVAILDGSIIFIDEPEMSMHPLWQQKILSYYEGIFNNTAQLIIATHSQGVISEALRDTCSTKVIVLRRDNNGIVTYGNITTPLVLNNNSTAEINYQAFGIASTDYHNALYGYIEAEGWKSDYTTQQGTNETYIKLNRDGSTSPQTISLSEKIRHIIHHPENTNNQYTNEELVQSIEDMRSYIIKKGGRIALPTTNVSLVSIC